MCYVILMNDKTNKLSATLTDLHWMVGPWSGALGPQTVEEAWSAPSGGTMSTMVRLGDPDATQMIELMVIREQDNTLYLHLRQFDPTLQLRLAQDMTLAAITEDRVRFAGDSDATIQTLTYRSVGPSQMEVDVAFGEDAVVTAALRRV